MDNVIEVSNLIKNFDVSKGFFSRNKTVVKAVDGISFSIPKGESLGLVGQSGCGKTTTARALCLLDPKTSGDVKFYNPEADEMQNLDDLSEEQVKQFRRNTQMIFQDPYESLNPRWTIKDIILEPLNIHNIGSLENRTEAVIEILKTVGLTPPQNYLPRYPHELSGGQRQRIGIARALYKNPKLLILDEPTSSLDEKTSKSFINTLNKIRKNIIIIIATHNLENLDHCDEIYEIRNKDFKLSSQKNDKS